MSGSVRRLRETYRWVSEFVHKHETLLWMTHSAGALGYGIFVMLFFHHNFSAVRKLGFFLLALWIMLIVIDLYVQWEERSGHNRRWVRLTLNYVLKNMYQGLYFFMLPFYWEATVFGSYNWYMLLLLTIGALLSTQDLIFDNWLMENRLARGLYYSFCLFSSLALLVPLVLPIQMDAAVVLAGALSSIGFFSLNISEGLLEDVESHLRSFPWDRLIALGLLFGLMAWLLRPFVPAVPYSLRRSVVSAMTPRNGRDIPTPGIHRVLVSQVRNRKLYSVRILYAPRDPYVDTFFEIWSLNGHVKGKSRVHMTKLADSLYLAYSESPPDVTWKPGRWNISLKTSSGRLLGKVKFDIIADGTVSEKKHVMPVFTLESRTPYEEPLNCTVRGDS